MRRAVVVHRGARDGYQVALALAERGQLERLVTDLYWPGDRAWARACASRLGQRALRLLEQRTNPLLAARLVRSGSFPGLLSFALDKWRSAPFSWRRAATRWADHQLGAAAGREASETGAALLSYSYYAYAAFTAAPRVTPRILFQLHPHPSSVRRILQRELALWPECARSLSKEWELALPDADFEKLVRETQMADRWIVASSFSRRTLVEQGADPDRVHVVPYGVALDRFTPPAVSRAARAHSGPLRLLFVGTINQRKGIRYLLEALRMLRGAPVELLVCGRVVDDLSLFRPLDSRVSVRASVSGAELLAAYQAADLFVFPSMAEGFGHVLLEAMACGLPVLSTSSTAAPDLITEGCEGFIVEPGRPDLLRDRIEWALDHRAELANMSVATREKAESFTWERFRAGIAAVVSEPLDSVRSQPLTAEVAHV